MPILYVSNDDGALYRAEHLDDPAHLDRFWALEVPEVITLTPDQLCTGYNEVADLLLKAGVARKV